MISVLQLGTLDYATGLRLQQRLVELRKEDRIGDVLLLLEHSPVITLGRNAKQKNIVASPELLAQRGVEVFECDRGGDVTFHGPGQLVGYPIFDLRAIATPDGKRKTLGAVDYVRRLEEVLIRTCADFGIPTARICGLTGVWTTRTLSSRAEQDNSLANCPAESRDLASTASGSQNRRHRRPHLPRRHLARFRPQRKHRSRLFQPDHPLRNHHQAGDLDGKRIGQGSFRLEEVAHSISRNFGTVFESQMLWLENLDALLGNSVGVPLKTPEELRQIHKEEDIFRA